jgi:uroporphyrinogen decarboxylase
MTKRERIKAIFAGQPVDRCGLWLGNPHEETLEIYSDYFKVNSEEQLRETLGDDIRWIRPDRIGRYYHDPMGKTLFGRGFTEHTFGQPGPLADCENVDQLDTFPWPDPEYLKFDDCLKVLEDTGNYYRMSGLWTDFFHQVADLFGMENYLMKMFTSPDVVHAVTERVCQFYLQGNEKFFELAGDQIDGFFFGNDFGTQLDLIMGPDQFDEFILPWFKKFIEQGHRHGYQVILHSCGSIYKVIDKLIGAGVDCIHPLQAKAANMDAETLAQNFKGSVAFMGAVDTQDLLVNASPEAIKSEVKRLMETLGPQFVVSPSHEKILPNIPPENIKAMADAVNLNCTFQKNYC